jgi:hypothetical protein
MEWNSRGEFSSAKEGEMPRLIVTAETGDERGFAIVHDERVLAATLDNDHASAQLIERVGWALEDAERLESEQAESPA